MKPEIINTTVVVVASQHNPSILHPAFLKSEEIVPADWERAEPPVCTPVFSSVKYKNNITFIVEASRLQVRDEKPIEDTDFFRTSSLAIKYVEKLPHVSYSAVGFNVNAFIEHLDPDIFLKDMFLKTGFWNDNNTKPASIGLQLVYPIGNGHFRLSCNAGKIKPPDMEEREGVLLSANFHADIHEEDKIKRIEKIKESILCFPEHYNYFIEFSEEIFNLKVKQ